MGVDDDSGRGLTGGHVIRGLLELDHLEQSKMRLGFSLREREGKIFKGCQNGKLLRCFGQVLSLLQMSSKKNNISLKKKA